MKTIVFLVALFLMGGNSTFEPKSLVKGDDDTCMGFHGPTYMEGFGGSDSWYKIRIENRCSRRTIHVFYEKLSNGRWKHYRDLSLSSGKSYSYSSETKTFALYWGYEDGVVCPLRKKGQIRLTV